MISIWNNTNCDSQFIQNHAALMSTVKSKWFNLFDYNYLSDLDTICSLWIAKEPRSWTRSFRFYFRSLPRQHPSDLRFILWKLKLSKASVFYSMLLRIADLCPFSLRFWSVKWSSWLKWLKPLTASLRIRPDWLSSSMAWIPVNKTKCYRCLIRCVCVYSAMHSPVSNISHTTK